MLRALPVVAISCAVAYAQTADVNLERVRSPKTSPSERMRLIEQMVQTDAGIDALARGALDATTDPEVVHMVVDQLLASGKFARALARVCLLLLDESRPNCRIRPSARWIVGGSKSPGKRDFWNKTWRPRPPGSLFFLRWLE